VNLQDRWYALLISLFSEMSMNAIGIEKIIVAQGSQGKHSTVTVHRQFKKASEYNCFFKTIWQFSIAE